MSRQNVTPLLAVRMADALRADHRTIDDLVAVSGLKKPTVARWVKNLREPEVRVVRIAAWSRDSDNRPYTPWYQWSTNPDAARPAAKSDAVRMREMRARKRAPK